MIKINNVKAHITDTTKKLFGFNFKFEPGLNIITGDNSSGKSTILSCIYYCLGVEQLINFGSGNGLKECLKVSFKYNDNTYSVFSSYAELIITNSNGDTAIIKRTIKSAYTENPNLISVTINDGETKDKFIHSEGDTDHQDGFYTWLSEFTGLSIPTYIDDDGKSFKILYMQQILASSFVEQTKGWSDFLAQIPIFATKKAKQKIIEYILGLNGLVDEFELEQLKEEEKEFKTTWSNSVDAFKSIISYYNIYSLNLPDNFTTDFTPTKIQKLELRTKINNSTINIDDYSNSLRKSINELIKKNSIDNSPIDSKELILSREETLKKITVLLKESEKINSNRINEELKQKKYNESIKQLTKEIEALEGLNKLSELTTIDIGSVENCPVCNSSLLSNSHAHFQNVEVLSEIKSISFYKSELNLFTTYLKNSETLINRFSKTLIYYNDNIQSLKSTLDTIDKQLVDDSRIPSRHYISEEVKLKFEFEQISKIKKLFAEFKSDLSRISEELALIRTKKDIIKSNKKSDTDKLYIFKNKFVELLTNFGYSKEILSRIFISPDESNKLFPVVSVAGIPPQPIRLVSSASDFIRAQWAYYMALLINAEQHLGILVLDEPGQHAMRSVDLVSLLVKASKIKDRQIIVAISKENRAKQIGDPILSEALKAVGLKQKIDYQVNIINDNSRIDKCIQPLNPDND